MKYLLDTDVVIHHLRRKKVLSIDIAKEGIGISIITLAELYYGAEKSMHRSHAFSAIEEFISLLSVEIVDLNKNIISEYAQIRATLEKKGEKLDEFDLLIGSTAKILGLTLFTGNIKHFNRIEGLVISS